MRDDFNNLKVSIALSPVAVGDDTDQVCNIIDGQGYDSLVYAISTGTLAATAATFTPLLEEGDESDLSDGTAVADADLLPRSGAETAFNQADDDELYKIGYTGSKRYTRLTIAIATNDASAPLSVVAIQGQAHSRPVPADDTPGA